MTFEGHKHSISTPEQQRTKLIAEFETVMDKLDPDKSRPVISISGRPGEEVLGYLQHNEVNLSENEKELLYLCLRLKVLNQQKASTPSAIDEFLLKHVHLGSDKSKRKK